MGRYKKIIKKVEIKKAEVKKEIPKPQKVEIKKEEVIDESNLIITKDLDKYTRLLQRGYRFKETKVEIKTHTFFTFFTPSIFFAFSAAGNPILGLAVALSLSILIYTSLCRFLVLFVL